MLCRTCSVSKIDCHSFGFHTCSKVNTATETILCLHDMILDTYVH